MKRVLLVLALAGCADTTAPTQPIRFGFDAPTGSITAPGYHDAYLLTADGGWCLLRRVTHLSEWFPVGPATFTVYEIERAPANPETGDTWRGTGRVWTVDLSLTDTDKLFSTRGIGVTPNAVYRIDVPVRHRASGQVVPAFDYARCVED